MEVPLLLVPLLLLLLPLGGERIILLAKDGVSCARSKSNSSVRIRSVDWVEESIALFQRLPLTLTKKKKEKKVAFSDFDAYLKYSAIKEEKSTCTHKKKRKRKTRAYERRPVVH